jgi:uncharacterized membrane protein YqgA involved in biofilm formation
MKFRQRENPTQPSLKQVNMLGTLLNIATVICGSLLGMLLAGRFPERVRQTIVSGLGLFTLGLGVQMFLKSQNILIVLGSLLLGALVGEWWRIEEGLQSFGKLLERKFMRGGSADQLRFVRGFLTASLLFCVGPMAILGSVDAGLTGNIQILAVKATLDGFASLAFASSLGIGVMFSILPLMIYQGGITLLAGQVQAVVSTQMMTEMSATGGLILMAIAFSSLLEIKPIRSGNFLPALVIAPGLVAVLALFQ